MNGEDRGRWYLLTGFVIGVLLGVGVAWIVVPQDRHDTSPASLRSDFKDDYRGMIAAAYVSNGNLPRARARLDLLRDPDPVRTLAEQAQRTLAEGRSPRLAQALGLLAVALGQGPAPVAGSPSPELAAGTTAAGPTPVNPSASITAPPASPSPGPQLSPTPAGPTQTPASMTTSSSNQTPLPTRTPTSPAQEPWVLRDQAFVCDQALVGPLIQISVESNGQPQPGVEAVVRWEGGEDHFFTGVKPDQGLGYADYTMQPGIEYTLQLVGGDQPVASLIAAECETPGGSRYWGSWRLEFNRP